MTDAPQLIPAHAAALRRVAAGGLFVATHRGVAPMVVRVVGGAHVVVASQPALRALRDGGYVEWTAGEGFGPWPLRLTAAGQRLVDGGASA